MTDHTMNILRDDRGTNELRSVVKQLEEKVQDLEKCVVLHHEILEFIVSSRGTKGVEVWKHLSERLRRP